MADKGRRGLVERALRYGFRNGLRRGLGDGNQVWLAVGAVAAGIRLLRWMAGPGKPTIVTELAANLEELRLHGRGRADDARLRTALRGNAIQVIPHLGKRRIPPFRGRGETLIGLIPSQQSAPALA